jgi:4-amino-4-deoxy-L-arabinose transferase-like glycosyltransferase
VDQVCAVILDNEMRLIQTIGSAPRRLLGLSVVAVTILYTVLAAHSATVHGFASSDAGVKLWQVQSIVRTGRLDAPIDYAGAAYDPDHQYSPFLAPWFFWENDQPYSEYVSPFIWGSAALYALWGHAGLLVLPWLAGVLSLIMATGLAWRLRPDRWAALAPVLMGLSSPLLLYSLEFWEHTPGVCLTLLALVGIVKATDGAHPWRWLIVAGAAAGLGLTMRAELYVFPLALVIGLLALRAALPLSRALIGLAVGGLLTAGPWWLYQFARWGSPLGPRVTQNVPALGGTDMLTRLGDTTGRNWTMLWPAGGEGLGAVLVLGITALGLATLFTIGRRWRLKQLVPVMLTASVIALAAVLLARMTIWNEGWALRPDDLLSTFPLILMLLFVPILHSNSVHLSREARFLAIVALAFSALVVIVSPFQGGVQWGPRFLLPAIAPLAIVVTAIVAKVWRNAAGFARVGVALSFGLLFMAGAASTVLGAKFIQDGQVNNLALSAVIEQLPDRVVVTDAWFLPQGAPYTFQNKIWLLAEDEKKMFDLIQRLRKTTDEPAMIYVSSLTWAHIDPLVRMGPRIALDGEFHYIDSPGTYLRIGRYLLLK